MKKLALVLAVAVFAGCEEKKPDGKPGKATASGEGSDPKAGPVASGDTRPKLTRKVVDPSKAGQIATYRCNCTKEEWKQPAEEEKLCIDYCHGEMPECGVLVKIEPASK